MKISANTCGQPLRKVSTRICEKCTRIHPFCPWKFAFYVHENSANHPKCEHCVCNRGNTILRHGGMNIVYCTIRESSPQDFYIMTLQTVILLFNFFKNWGRDCSFWISSIGLYHIQFLGHKYNVFNHNCFLKHKFQKVSKFQNEVIVSSKVR